MKLKTALTIAGSDSSGGAGIQADIKAMMANGVFAMSAVTALTAQNTTGVFDVSESSPEFLATQIDAVFSDIPPDAVKIGMVSSIPLIRVIASRLRAHNAKNIVVDPVMVATSGARLINEDAASALAEELFPIASVITPNLPELLILNGSSKLSNGNSEQIISIAKNVSARWKVSVLAKGGHSGGDCDDFLVTGEYVEIFRGRRVDTKNTHGTGCTLSSAIAANLAKGMNLSDAVRRAKDYVYGAIASGLTLGSGNGPIHHGFALSGEFL